MDEQKPSGEAIYLAYCAAQRKDDPPEGTVDSLRTVVNMIREYAIPELPATENGQVPFLRAVLDSAVAEIEQSIIRQGTDQETAAANERHIRAIPSLCRGEDVECVMHVSQPIRELRETLSAVKQDVAYWVQLAKYQRHWFENSHNEGKNAGPCPTDAAIAASEKLIGRVVACPSIE